MKVVIVGAGLAGLTAAVHLTAAGHDVVVVEGRDEVGGRSRSLSVDGDVIELGAQFISRNHLRMRNLVAHAGLHLIRDHYAAGVIRWRRPHDQVGQLSPHLGPSDLVVLSRVLLGARSLRSLSAAATVELQRAELDSQSVADWLKVLERSASAHYIADCLVGALFGGADLGDISLLEFVELLGREGGPYRFLIGEVGRASHIVEGTSALCAALSAKLTGQVHLSASVTAVEQDNASVAVHVANGDMIEGDHAVVAVPTPAVSHINFTPNLPASIRDANAAIHYGQATKIAAVVAPRKPLQAKAFVGGSLIVAGWRTRRVLYGFALQNTERLDTSTLAEDLCRGFGVVPQTVEQIEVASWPQDHLTCGTYAHLSPGRFTQFRRSLPHRHGRVHFAGGERSSWPIYMEGAVESGEQAAQSVTAICANSS